MSMLRAALVVLIAGSACAKGGSGVDPPVDARPVDAPSFVTDGPTSDGSFSDAPLTDAPVQVDALLPDGGGGLFCTANSQCTVSGECCLTLGGPTGFCAPGTVVIGVCVPFD